MKFYGIELAAGSEIQNLIIERGVTNPPNLTSIDRGRLFFNDIAATVELWDGVKWIAIASSNTGIVTSLNTRTGALTLISSDLVGLIDSSNLPIASGSVLGGIKIGTGLTIDGNGVASTIGVAVVVPAGTRMLFSQSSAPSGWVQDTTDTANNRMLRVVNGSGGGVGGTHDPTIMNVVPAHYHGYSGTTSGVGDHVHPYTTRAGTQPQSGDSTQCWWLTATGYTGGAGAHSHTFSGATDYGSSQVNWSPRFTNLIICVKS